MKDVVKEQVQQQVQQIKEETKEQAKQTLDTIKTQVREEVKNKINHPDYQKFSVLGIAFEAGFNSKSAFNRVFKNITGQTPTQFKKQHSG